MPIYIRNLKIPYKSFKISSHISVSDQLERLLPTLTPDAPVLLQAGTGAGKTTAILDVLVPFAQEQGKRVLFVSSRCAINLQVKRRLAKNLGAVEILTDYSDEGLRKLETIGPVTILTYHALWNRMNTAGDGLRNVDFLVFDEVHALVLDASFVRFTGQLLERIPWFFSQTARIYLSATPDPILSKLAFEEGNSGLTAFQWKPDYSAYVLYFYSGQDDLLTHLRKLPREEKCLLFVDSIKEGNVFRSQLPDSQLITAETRRQDPDRWNRLISDPVLPTQFTIATSTLDAGVSLVDPDLHHIVCCGLDFAALVQQAGRKRLKSGEKVSLYIQSPTRKQLSFQQKQVLELRANLELCESSPEEFVQRFLLDDDEPALRKICYRTSFSGVQTDPSTGLIISGTMHAHQFRANPLTITAIDNQLQLYETLLKRSEEHPFEKYICKLFGQPLPTDSSRWLDGRFDTANRDKFWNFITENSGKTFSEKGDQEKFSSEFKALYIAAYGPRKGDRSDRGWGANIIKSVLADCNCGYQLETGKKGWKLTDRRQQSA